MRNRRSLLYVASAIFACTGFTAAARAGEADIGRCARYLYGYNPETRYVGRTATIFDNEKDTSFAAEEEALVKGLVDAIDKVPAGRKYFHVLALSGGGQWGAYGAGFLRGWSEAQLGPNDPRREDIDIVTGVSTGAMQTTLAFAGSIAHDIEHELPDHKFAANIRAGAHLELKRAYTTPPEGGKLAEPRGAEVLWKQDALYSVDGLEKAVADGLTNYLYVYKGAMRQRAYVGVVNVDRNEFFVVDMKGIADSNESDDTKKACLGRVILASAAVPIAFPPRKIGGDMFVDGGARQALFASILLTRPEIVDKLNAKNLKPFVHVIINGNQNANSYAKKKPAKTKPSFMPIVKASMRNVLDQLYRDAAYRNEHDLKEKFRTGYCSRYTYVTNDEIKDSQDPNCLASVNEQSEEVFDYTFMKCLEKLGYDKGKEQIWVPYQEVPADAERTCVR